MPHRLTILAFLAIALTMPPLEATRANFVPDWTFKGSDLDGLAHSRSGRLEGERGRTGRRRRRAPTADGCCSSGSFQDVQIGFDVRCAAACKVGVLLRAEKTAEGGMKGVWPRWPPTISRATRSRSTPAGAS